MTTRSLRIIATACGVVLAWCQLAIALDPRLDVSQYAHTAWRMRDGFAKGSITSITQTPDGYLWLGTESGLLRFDGVRAVPWQPPPGQRLPSNVVRSLLAARDGTLWIGTDQGLASWKNGQLTRHDELSGTPISKLTEDREGSIWMARFLDRWTLCQVHKAGVTCYGEDGGPGAGALGIYEDRAGVLWVGTDDGLWRWKPGRTFYSLPGEPNGIQGISEDNDGSLLIAKAGAIRRLVNGQAVVANPFPWSTEPVQALRLLRDRDGGLWAGTSTRGLIHIHDGITDVFSRTDGLSSEAITAIFEDREGTIWVATDDGLDRFHESPVVSYSVTQGLSTSRVASVLASTDGSLWVATFDNLNRLTNGQLTVYREGTLARRAGASAPLGSRAVREITGVGMPFAVQSMLEDSRRRVWLSTSRGVGRMENERFVLVEGLPSGLTRAIVEDSRKTLWIANLKSGLFRLSGADDVEQIGWEALQHKDPVSAMVADSVRDGLWVGFFRGGISYFAGGQVRESYAASDGLAEGRVSALYADQAGTLWAATDGGLSRLKNGRAATLTSRNGLPCDAVGWVIDDANQSLWLGMACGLVRIAHEEIEAWTAAIDTSVDNFTTRVQTTVFDQADGVRLLPSASYYTAPVARSPDGKLWFISQEGISVIDPARLSINKLLPPVHIEQVVADRRTYNASLDIGSPLRLPPLIRDLQIDYTALSLVTPEKMRFRYLLEGYDAEWHDVGTRRQAFYNDLPPRRYRFRVMASNNGGMWNEASAALEFSIAPAYYQTTWFRLSAVATFLLVLAALYRLRVKLLAQRFDVRMEERVNERTRIARELHDTLLQSFQGTLLKFHAVTYTIADRPEAKQMLEKVIAQATEAVTEGRDAVQGLRSSTLAGNNLAQALSALGEELARDHHQGAPPACSVQVEGTPRDLAPLVHDDVYRIAAEALRNAFRHAQAQRIEVEIRYGQRVFRLRVRDDGKGIAPTVLADKGRDGHYGLTGMHERAGLIKGKLSIWSERNSGSETELVVPASAAYPKE